MGFDDPVDKGVTIIRDQSTIKAVTGPSFYCNLLADPDNPFTIGTAYSIILYSKVGADSNSMSQNGCSPLALTQIGVKYSVSLEPITAGATGGTPTLTGYENSAQAQYPTHSRYPGEASPRRPLANSEANINRGMNAASDSIGSNSSGADIRGTSNGNGTFSGSTYTAGTGSDPDTIAEETIFSSAINGTRTTGLANYGEKGIAVVNNAGTANGFELDYYGAQVFHPVTGEAIGWVQDDGFVDTAKARLTEAQMNSYLSGTGIFGKTKIYVAYKSKVSFIKADDKTSANPLTAASVGEQNLPSFTLYSDAACTQYAIDSDFDGTATEAESVFAYNQTTGEVSSFTDGRDRAKDIFHEKTAPGFAENGRIYTVNLDEDGNITFETSEGFMMDGTAYSLPSTPLPVNIKLQAGTTLGGKTDKLVAEQFKFVLKQTGTPDGVSKLIPDSGIDVYNYADGSTDFSHVLTFTAPGAYTFSVKEDANYRKPGLDDKVYNGIVFDDTERTISIVVRWADKNAGDPETENRLKAIISVDGTPNTNGPV